MEEIVYENESIARSVDEGTWMSNYFDFHEKDILLNIKGQNYVDYCTERDLEKTQWTPFLSFPITKSCNFRCIYCGFGGEATGAIKPNTDFALIKKISELGIRNGIKKFRVTGGEPFLHKDIGNILSYFSELGVFTLVNTNGSLLLKKAAILDALKTNIKFAVSLDTLISEKLPIISHNDCLVDVINGIKYLQQKSLLLRVNMVVGQHNYSEIDDIIDFCKQLRCDLKILDIVSVPVPFGKRGNYYAEVTTLEQRLSEQCDGIYSHEYTRGFGTPCYKYRFGDTFVTVKNSVKGSHYDLTNEGLCEGCKYFPCHEGLYDIFALSDSRLCACRWTEVQKFEESEMQLRFLIEAFRRARYIPRKKNDDMLVRTELQA